MQASVPLHATFNNETSFMGGHDYVREHPVVASVYLLVQAFACIGGTAGNLLVLATMATQKSFHRASNMFLVNLAISDTCVTGIVDPFGAIAMVAGKEYFDARHGLCDFVSAICIVLCVNALLSIGAISFNRYVHICHTAYYERIFSKRNNAIMIAAFWTLGVAITTPLFFGWGAHVFDGKSLECVWDRTSHLSYTLFFVICIVLTPVIIISFSFIGIYRHVTNSKKRLAAFNEKNGGKKDGGKEEKSSRKLARTLFAIFMLFVACWMPYSVLMVVDFGDTAPHEIYLFAVQLAHLHSSLNFVMYAITNGQMRKAYRQTLLTIFPCCRCLRNNRVGADDTTRGRTMGGESTIVSDGQ